MKSVIIILFALLHIHSNKTPKNVSKENIKHLKSTSIEKTEEINTISNRPGYIDHNLACRLPKQIRKLKAVKINNKVHVSWNIIGKFNYWKIILEKSVDGFSFTEVSTIYLKPTKSNHNEYIETDFEPGGDGIMYRLKIISTKSGIEYSPVINIQKPYRKINFYNQSKI